MNIIDRLKRTIIQLRSEPGTIPFLASLSLGSHTITEIGLEAHGQGFSNLDILQFDRSEKITVPQGRFQRGDSVNLHNLPPSSRIFSGN